MKIGDSRSACARAGGKPPPGSGAGQILELLRQLKAQREQTVDVEMVSAFEVPDAVRERIAAALGEAPAARGRSTPRSTAACSAAC
jgi:hypothetical protein